MDIQDKQITLRLISKQKTEIQQKMDNGEDVPADELKKLVQMETNLRAEIEAEEEGLDPVIGRLRVKRRKYTMTDAALKQRRDAAEKSTGPVTEEGKARSSGNAWKHGMHAKKRLLGLGKPCKSTCPKFPCSLVDDGDLSPGDNCLDKQYFLSTLNALSDAMQNGKLDSLKEIITVQLGGTLQVIDELQTSILEYGVYMKSEKIDKAGNIIGYEIKPNPSLLPLANLLKTAGVTMPDFMVTPAALEKKKSDEAAVETLADIFRGAGNALKQAKDKKA